MSDPLAVLRRARPLLGTLVEIGVPRGAPGNAPTAPNAPNAIDQAFAVLAEVQAELSRFEPHSDVACFAALPPGGALTLRPHAHTVLTLAAALGRDSGGLFDITLGHGPGDWSLDGASVRKHRAGVAFDLGGIAKGYAVDQAVDALQRAGAAAGWVNAGGDLRVFGDLALPVSLRDEAHGGVRPFMLLRDGALATSRFAPGSRSQLVMNAGRQAVHDAAHVSVVAPRCAWADALTKVVAASGDVRHALLRREGAQAWWHGRQALRPAPGTTQSA